MFWDMFFALVIVVACFFIVVLMLKPVKQRDKIDLDRRLDDIQDFHQRLRIHNKKIEQEIKLYHSRRQRKRITRDSEEPP